MFLFNKSFACQQVCPLLGNPTLSLKYLYSKGKVMNHLYFLKASCHCELPLYKNFTGRSPRPLQGLLIRPAQHPGQTYQPHLSM